MPSKGNVFSLSSCLTAFPTTYELRGHYLCCEEILYSRFSRTSISCLNISCHHQSLSPGEHNKRKKPCVCNHFFSRYV